MFLMASHPKKLRHHWFFASYNKPDVSPLIPDRAKHPILNHFSIILSIVRKDFLKCPISHDGIHHMTVIWWDTKVQRLCSGRKLKENFTWKTMREDVHDICQVMHCVSTEESGHSSEQGHTACKVSSPRSMGDSACGYRRSIQSIQWTEVLYHCFCVCLDRIQLK